MDVFIPEEYVLRRRMEKRAAALARKMAVDNAAQPSQRTAEMDESDGRQTTRSGLRKIDSTGEFVLVSSARVPSESIVFSCFSA
ncbi:hypothetical protein CDL15_Pgr017901 [Punica granatum]|uniref:Uncharacterized protein n=1 Tax=Punica granatum TaxID=22663 RepID=A0A218WHN3_PUNGR|nr:hypothetical protein CDL15_Pgr017901 [Punica granatum]PKI65336.1 hypothetical protein CRG98_014300 [Punica granatum]